MTRSPLTSFTVRLPAPDRDPDCHGWGFQPGTTGDNRPVCARCRGLGGQGSRTTWSVRSGDCTRRGKPDEPPSASILSSRLGQLGLPLGRPGRGAEERSQELDPYSKRTPPGAIEHGATILFHDGSKIFLNHVR